MNLRRWALVAAALANLLACDLMTYAPLRNAPNDPVAPVAAPVFDPPGGTVSLGETVRLSCATVGASIYYSIDGATDVTESDFAYVGPFTLSVAGTVTVRAKAFKAGRTASDMKTEVYTVDAAIVATPAFSPTSGAVPSGQKITIFCLTDGADIRYTLDSSAPTDGSTLYSDTTKPTITSAVTLKARAFKSGMTPSGIASSEFSLTTSPTVTTPGFSPAGGLVPAGTTVQILCDPADARIYYTTDGTTEPSESSTLYSDAARPAITQNTTLKAKAFKTGMDPSTTATTSYTVAVAMPTFVPGSSAVASGTPIQITWATSGAEIRYTTDGTTEPTLASTLYNDAARPPIAAATTLKARAFKSALEPSATATASYTIATSPAFRLNRVGVGTVANGATSTLPDVMISQSGTAVTFEIWNDGTANLVLSGSPLVGKSGTNAGEFTLAQPASSTVPPSQSVSFTAVFSPTVPAGAKTATLTIASNDATYPSFSYNLGSTATKWHGLSSATVASEADCSFQDMAVSGDTVYVIYYNVVSSTRVLARSTDGGATWPTGNRTTIYSALVVNPRIAVSGTGATATVFVSYGRADNLYVARSLDGGSTFSEILAASKPAGDPGSNATGDPSIAVSGTGASTYVYVGYLERAIVSAVYQFRAKVARSADQGATWTVWTVDETNAFGQTYPTVGFYTSVWAGTGTNPPVYVTYEAKNVGAADRSEAMFAKTIDDGTPSWTKKALETSASFATNEVGINAMGHGLTASGTTVFSVYLSKASGTYARCLRSIDSGDTWSGCNIVSTTNGGFSAVYAPGNYLYVGFAYSTGPFVTRSTDGTSWTDIFRMIETPVQTWGAPVIAASGSIVYAGYLWDAPANDYLVRFGKSIDSGNTW